MIFKVQKMEDTPNKRLPIEMQVVILLRLPVKSLVRFKCVSKNWLAEITSQSFIDLYNCQNYPQNHDTNHRYLILVGSGSISSFDYSISGRGIVSNFALPLEFHKKLDSEIVGSCNGLLCFENLTSRKILVYNPITRANRVIRIPAFPDANTEYETGFGYDHKSNDYKIFWVSRKRLAYIFRLKSNTCEEIKFTPTRIAWHFGSYQKVKPFMVYSNNALHWVGYSETPGHKIISCFDIGSEQFYELRMPHYLITTYMSWNIADLKGYLHLVSHRCPNWSSPRSLEIWVMKEYRVHSSWTKLISYSSVEHIFSHGQSTLGRNQVFTFIRRTIRRS
ncbi:F-box/kelch-repeat protein At3g23880-like [Silene latifolia]|uniref:F-box/kelch-repeat protein At3g23880-like n=1 Tax=Silene latifolia TaxID=37657 RepID=UPI003D781D20